MVFVFIFQKSFHLGIVIQGMIINFHLGELHAFHTQTHDCNDQNKYSKSTSSLLRCSAIIIAFLSSSLNIGSLTGGPEPVVDNLTTTCRESDLFHKYGGEGDLP